MITQFLLPLVLASINVELRHTDDGMGIFMIGNGVDLVASMEIAIDADILGATNEPFLMNFPPFPSFLACNDDLSDGGMWIGLVPGGVEFAPSVEGTLVATLDLGCGFADIPETLDGCVTVVWDGTVPNIVVTGTLTGAHTADFNNDGTVGILDYLLVLAATPFDIADFLCVLGEWGWQVKEQADAI